MNIIARVALMSITITSIIIITRGIIMNIIMRPMSIIMSTNIIIMSIP